MAVLLLRSIGSVVRFARAANGAQPPGGGSPGNLGDAALGVGLLTDAVLRVVMSYTLPIPVVPGPGGALWPVTFVLLQVVSNV
jgi:hypothetical protein